MIGECPGAGRISYKPGRQKGMFEANRLQGVVFIGLVAAFLLAPVRATPQNFSPPPDDFIWGIKAGYSILNGYYAGKLEPSYYFGLYTIPYVTGYFMAEIDASYSSHELSGSRGSYLYTFTAAAGPLVSYPLFSFLHPYAGASLRGSYLRLDTASLGEQESAYKAGFILKAGAFIPLRHGVGARLGGEFSQVWLSDRPLRTVNMFAGVSYNFGTPSFRDRDDIVYTDKRTVKTSETNRLYLEGLAAYEAGRLDEALGKFEAVLKLEPGHADARRHAGAIRETKELYSRALGLMERKPFEAIPLLQKAGARLSAARETLQSLRARLMAQVPELERRGIAAYEAKHYRDCMGLMNRILLIDPSNKTAKIYLPRARKRHEALEKLK